MINVHFSVVVAALLLLPGCLSQEPPVDLVPLAAALKFVGVCTVLSSLIWAIAIVRSSNRRK